MTLAAGPTLSALTSIGAGTITAPGPLAYCPSLGPSGVLGQDVLFALAVGSSGGVLYRVNGASGADPQLSTALSGLSGPGMGLASLAVNCASGTVLLASGNAADGLRGSTDGGATFTTLATYGGSGRSQSAPETPSQSWSGSPAA